MLEIFSDDPVWSRPDTYDHRNPASVGYHPYQSQPPADNCHTTYVHSTIKPIPDSDIYRVGIYGWRKRCLYAFILLLTIIIFINLAFTAWIMTVLNFSLDGIGALKIEEDRIKVLGRSEFEKPVQLSQLSTTNDDVLSIDSGFGVSISAHNFTGHSTTSLNLRPDGQTTIICDRFEVLDSNKKLLFFVDSKEIGYKLENLRILDDGGSIFEGAIQTSKIRPESDHPLSLESPTRSLKIEAGQDLELLSSAGEIVINSLLDLKMNSKQGDIHFESSNLYISGLGRSTGQGNMQYQLCICQNGRLFLAIEHADCRADRTICE